MTIYLLCWYLWSESSKYYMDTNSTPISILHLIYKTKQINKTLSFLIVNLFLFRNVNNREFNNSFNNFMKNEVILREFKNWENFCECNYILWKIFILKIYFNLKFLNFVMGNFHNYLEILCFKNIKSYFFFILMNKLRDFFLSRLISQRFI